VPFASKDQRAYLFMHHPGVAKEFAAHTSDEQEKHLPKKKRKRHPRRLK
jgi:hypothetical protein